MDVFVPLSHVKKTVVQGSRSYCKPILLQVITVFLNSVRALATQVRSESRTKRAFFGHTYLGILWYNSACKHDWSQGFEQNHLLKLGSLLASCWLCFCVDLSSEEWWVWGTSWPLAAKSSNIVTCDPWERMREPQSPSIRGIAWKKTLTRQLDHVLECGWQCPLDWYLPLYQRFGVPLLK